MSNLRPSIAVVLLAVAAALVQIPTAEAQTARSGGTSTDPGGGPGGKLILPGTPGNCGPTIAGCPPTEEPKKTGRKVKHCDHWEIVKTAGGATLRRCRDQ